MASSPTLNKSDSLWHFNYYSGCGNLFLIAADPEDIESNLSRTERAALCNALDVVVDGLLFLGSNLRMHYYNRDGSRANMCGNGLRCLGHFAHSLGAQDTFFIETDLGPRAISIQKNGLVMTDMGVKPTVTEPLENWFFCTTGVPHAVQFLETLPEGSIEEIARPLRYSPAFGPNGTNVSFATINSKSIHLRTYERGVEQETGACGTGACAAALIASERFSIPFPITIQFHSGEQALVTMQENRLSLTAGCAILSHYALPNPFKARSCTSKTL